MVTKYATKVKKKAEFQAPKNSSCLECSLGDLDFLLILGRSRQRRRETVGVKLQGMIPFTQVPEERHLLTNSDSDPEYDWCCACAGYRTLTHNSPSIGSRDVVGDSLVGLWLIGSTIPTTSEADLCVSISFQS